MRETRALTRHHTALPLVALLAGCAHATPAASTQTGAPARSDPASDQESAQHHRTHGDAHGYDKDFSSVQAYAARFDSETRDAWQKPEEVVRLLELEPGMTVADVGAGTGYFLGPLDDAVGAEGRVLALDVEPNMVRYMRQRAQEQGWQTVEAREVAPDDPGLAPASVDRILIVNTWHHISDRERYATKLHAALRPGGSVMIVDFTRESDQGPPPEHRLSPEQVVAETSSAGLKAEVIEETLPKQYVVVGRKVR